MRREGLCRPAGRRAGCYCDAQGASITKADATRNYGARVIQEGDNYDECFQIAWRMAEAEGYEYIHAFDDPLIIAGQGTIALEVLETQPEIRQLVVPIGGGGLISGIAVAAKALNPSVRVVGVRPGRRRRVSDLSPGALLRPTSSPPGRRNCHQKTGAADIRTHMGICRRRAYRQRRRNRLGNAGGTGAAEDIGGGQAQPVGGGAVKGLLSPLPTAVVLAAAAMWMPT